MFEDNGRFLDLDRMINETVNREVDAIEESFLGDLFFEGEEDHPEPKRGRGRPKGVKESTPRKRKPSLSSIREHIESALGRLELL